MPKLQSVKGKNLVKILNKIGWHLDHIQGSHYILRNENGKKLTVAVHGNSEIPKGTFIGILNDADISKEIFEQLVFRFCKINWKFIVQGIKDEMAKAKEMNDTTLLNDLLVKFLELKVGMQSRGLI